MPPEFEQPPWHDAVQIVHHPDGGWHLVVDREKMRLLDESLLAPFSLARIRAIERVENLPQNAPGRAKDQVAAWYSICRQWRIDRRNGRILPPGVTTAPSAHPAGVNKVPRDMLPEFASGLRAAGVRYVLIGMWAADMYAREGGEAFDTLDQDLFLPPDPENLLRTWQVAEQLGFELSSGGEPLDLPRDLWLAERVVQRRALTRAQQSDVVPIDLTLTMGGGDFEAAWAARRVFLSRGVEVEVARLLHIVESKRVAGRKKDLTFLATHEDALMAWTEAEQRRIDAESGRGGGGDFDSEDP